MQISNKVLDCIEILSKSNEVISLMIADATPEVDSLFGEIAGKISDLIKNIKDFTRDIFIIEKYIVCDRAKQLYPSIDSIPEEIKKQVIKYRNEDEICLFTLEPCSCQKEPETLVKKLKYFLEEMDKRRDRSASISENLSDSISKIREGFAKFNQDIAFIVEIAEKVDLIAINAYVEAARMGEKGKGFEIIAENIRKAALDIQTHGRDINLRFSELEDEFIKNEDIFKNYMEHEKLRKENDKKASETIKQEIVELVDNFVKFVEFTSSFSKEIFETVQNMQLELTEKMQYVDIYNQRIGNIGKNYLL